MTDKATPSHASADSVMALKKLLGDIAAMLSPTADSYASDDPSGAIEAAYSVAVNAIDICAEVERLAAQAAPTDTEMVLVPPWKGYALLGTGNYILNSSAAPPDPKLGAEFFITFATDADKSGNRQVGETRANDPNAAPVQPEEMVLRIGFLTPQALCALEGQLRVLREENFPESVAAQPSQAPVVQSNLEAIRGAVARGWCHPKNSHKAMDSDLALAIADEVSAINAAPVVQAVQPTQAVRMLTDAARDVLAERQRQISAEGWTPEHDDEHDAWSMAVAAACYSLWDRPATQATTGRLSNLWQWTGWDQSWFKPKDPRRNLVRAAALLLAEIERLDRAGRTIPPSGEIGGAA